MFWSPLVENLSPYTAGEQPGGDIIKLNTNENPYPPSPLVIEAIDAAFKNRSLGLYPDPGCKALREAAAEYFKVKPENVFCGNGSDEVLAFAFAAFFAGAQNTTQKILFPDITYSFYKVYCKLWNIPYTEIPLNNNFLINTDDYMQENNGVIFAEPNAPTGIALGDNAINTVIEWQKKIGKVCIIDKAYSAFAKLPARLREGPGEGLQYTIYNNLLNIYTLSKSHALAGLRVGFAIGDAHLIKGLERVRDSFNSYPVDTLAQAGATAALRDKKYYDDTTEKVIATRERMGNQLKEKQFTVLPSDANFLFIKHPLLSGETYFSMLRKQNILVRHWNTDKIADYVRVTIGTDEQMNTFMEASLNENYY
ncbi:MAG: aminotransferase class I/II-fold pyridoxal phosphate-dependent enzyme [Spirochaetaceae bacterium]|jgi:histidinol-phosphate aminotransferase|nr:aminotransferase class I/II-fold pyridoxal phosphate-dependent enzyme [Spirochaetaceae bacterium]